MRHEPCIIGGIRFHATTAIFIRFPVPLENARKHDKELRKLVTLFIPFRRPFRWHLEIADVLPLG